MAFSLTRSLRGVAKHLFSYRLWLAVITLCISLSTEVAAQDLKRSERQIVTGGILQKSASTDSVKIETKEELKLREKMHRRMLDSLARYEQRLQRAREQDRIDEFGNIIPRDPLFSDSSSLSKVCRAGLFPLFCLKPQCQPHQHPRRNPANQPKTSTFPSHAHRNPHLRTED